MTTTITEVAPKTRISFQHKAFGHTRTVEGILEHGKIGQSAMTGRYVFEVRMDGNPSPAVFSLRANDPVEVIA